MNSRERITAALNHCETDRVPIDLGSCGQTGINASTLYKLRAALGLHQHPIKIIEPFQMLGEVEKDLLDLLGCDMIGLWNQGTILGYTNTNYKPWTMPDGTPVLMGGKFEYDRNPQSGNYMVYPGGDRTAPYSLRMTKEGSFFDNIERAEDYDEDHLTPYEDFKNDFTVATDEMARYWEREAKRLFEETEYAIMGVLGGGGLGDVALIPGPYLKMPKGIRSIADWLMAHAAYPDYIQSVFEMQTDSMIKNMEIYHEAVGEKISVLWMSGTDFGTQNSTFNSLGTFKSLYKPFYKRMNDWVHQHTSWKTFYHTCGAIAPLLDDLADMGVDCLNPVQLSATGMDSKMLKDKYGDKFVFWGAGVDTQSTLPFGTAEEVRRQVAERITLFNRNGGYVFNPIHNIVSGVPVENVIAMYETAAGRVFR